jgi:hypothetical protein
MLAMEPWNPKAAYCSTLSSPSSQSRKSMVVVNAMVARAAGSEASRRVRNMVGAWMLRNQLEAVRGGRVTIQ